MPSGGTPRPIRLLKSAESGNISVQSSTIQKASALIDESKQSLDQSSAQAVIDRAAAQIKNVDEMLTFFKANKELANDPRVAAITVKRESADQFLTSARDSQEPAISTRPGSGRTNPRPRRSRPTTTRSISEPNTLAHRTHPRTRRRLRTLAGAGSCHTSS